MDYGRTPTPTATDAQYGAHWWLVSRSARVEAAEQGFFIPQDASFASGFEGQFIVVIPSRELVLMQLSLDLPCGSPVPLICGILGAFPE